MPFKGGISFCIFLASQGSENKPKGGKSSKYRATNVSNKIGNSSWGHLGPSCTNSLQKAQVEVPCVGPESPKTAILSTQNDHFDIMHFGNHAFCLDRIP